MWSVFVFQISRRVRFNLDERSSPADEAVQQAKLVHHAGGHDPAQPDGEGGDAGGGPPQAGG